MFWLAASLLCAMNATIVVVLVIIILVLFSFFLSGRCSSHQFTCTSIIIKRLCDCVYALALRIVTCVWNVRIHKHTLTLLFSCAFTDAYTMCIESDYFIAMIHIDAAASAYNIPYSSSIWNGWAVVRNANGAAHSVRIIIEEHRAHVYVSVCFT